MPCCRKPIATIIKVGELDVGILGLEQAMHNVYRSSVNDDDEITRDLLKLVKEYGNFISHTREHEYEKALLREYKKYVRTMGNHPTAIGTKPR